MVWENVVYTIIFLVKFFSVLQDIWNKVMNCIGLVDVLLWPKILGNCVFSVGFDSDGLFLQMSEKYFHCSSLKNNKCICQEDFFVDHVTGSTDSRIVFRAMYISMIYTNLQKEVIKTWMLHTLCGKLILV